jgi:polar amino acid transport system substrate-binding protein
MHKVTVLFALLFCQLLTFSSKAQTITFLTGEWPPYTSEKIYGGGLITEIVNATITEMQIDAIIKFVPWERGEKMLKNGEAFGSFPYAITPERQQDFLYSDRLLVNPSGKFFYKVKNFPTPLSVNSLSDFKSYKFSLLAGEASEELFNAAGVKVESVISDELNIQRLYKERVDFTQMDPVLGWYLIEKLYPGETHLFGTLDITFQELIGDTANSDWDSYLMVSPNYPNSEALLEQFNLALEQIIAKGIYDEILVKYSLDL